MIKVAQNARACTPHITALPRLVGAGHGKPAPLRIGAMPLLHIVVGGVHQIRMNKMYTLSAVLHWIKSLTVRVVGLHELNGKGDRLVDVY